MIKFVRQGCMNKKNFQAGFTLIELLVVISVIGLLASIVLVALNSARAKARDAKRRSDIDQASSALAVYYDANNAYPTTSGSWWGNCIGYGAHGTTGASGWIPNLAPTYIGQLPGDAIPPNTGKCYLYQSNGTDYKILAYLTVENCPVPTTDPLYDPARPGCVFARYSSSASVDW
ncbi:MAG: type II secretion system protein [Candidatus Doudnabacteria bacterium]